MSKETSIGVSQATKQLLEQENGNGLENTIKNLLSLKKCPECGERELKIIDAYMFEPLYFDLECPNCGYINEHWRVPFKVKK